MSNSELNTSLKSKARSSNRQKLAGMMVGILGLVLPTTTYITVTSWMTVANSGVEYASISPETATGTLTDAVSPSLPSALIENSPEDAIETDEEARKRTEAFVWALRSKLEDIDLDIFLNVQAGENGGLLLSGRLPESSKSRFENLKVWIKNRESFPELTEEISFVATEEYFPEIKSVWLGSIPRVHFTGGKVAGVGTDIGDGWQVDSIDSQMVVLRRNGKKLALKY